MPNSTTRDLRATRRYWLTNLLGSGAFDETELSNLPNIVEAYVQYELRGLSSEEEQAISADGEGGSSNATQEDIELRKWALEIALKAYSLNWQVKGESSDLFKFAECIASYPLFGWKKPEEPEAPTSGEG